MFRDLSAVTDLGDILAGLDHESQGGAELVVPNTRTPPEGE